MTDLPSTRFLLELRLDTKPPRAVMSDFTTGAPTGPIDIELGAAPYQLGMAFTAATPTGPLQPQLSSLQSVPPAPPPPFDPALTGDDGILLLDWDLRDRGIDTQDETVLVLALTNRSYYYEAAQLEIHLDLAPADGSALEPRPDGSALVSIWPNPQSVRCIGPRSRAPQIPDPEIPGPHGTVPPSTVQFEYVVVTRGPRAGLYRLSVEVRYQLVYVYRELVRQTTAIAHVPLRIHGGSEPPVTGKVVSPPSSSRFEQITIAQRKLHMSDLIEKEVEYTQSRRRDLHAIEHKVSLPGGGEICVAYRLVKGSHNKPDDTRCSYGYNPRTKETESYFSTSDEAALELKLVNHSPLHLRHVNITDVHLFMATDSGGLGQPADTEKLPDGNHLFEVLPGEVYFGHLDPEQLQTRYLGLVTRGIKPGRFLVRFEVHYEIVDGAAWVALPLLVNPD